MTNQLQKIIAAIILVSFIGGILYVPTAQALVPELIGVTLGTAIAGGKCGGIIGKIGSTINNLAARGIREVGHLAKELGKALGLGGIGRALSNFFGGAGSRLNPFGSGRVPVEEKGSAGAAVINQQEKECVLDPLARALVSILISELTASTISWIQGVDRSGSNVGFVDNVERRIKRELNAQAGEFINQLAGINLCGNIRPYLQIRLGAPRTLQRDLRCTLTDIVDNVEDFFNDFQTGGWPAFISVSLNPQNNPYGAQLIALDALIIAQNEKKQGIQAGYQAGAGFLGYQVDEAVCDPVSPAELENISRLYGGDETIIEQILMQEGAKLVDGTWQYCTTHKVTKTPGTVISSLLNKTIGAGIDSAVAADEIDEAINSIIGALINRLINGGPEGRGIFGPSGDPRLAAAQGRALATEFGTEPVSTPLGGGPGGAGPGSGGGGLPPLPPPPPPGFVSNEKKVELLKQVMAETARLQFAVASLDQTQSQEVTNAVLLGREFLLADETTRALLKPNLKTSINQIAKLKADKDEFIAVVNNLLGVQATASLLGEMNEISFASTTQFVADQKHRMSALLTTKGLSAEYPDLNADAALDLAAVIDSAIQLGYRSAGRAGEFESREFKNQILPIAPEDKKLQLEAKLTNIKNAVEAQFLSIQSLASFLPASGLESGILISKSLYQREVEFAIIELSSQAAQADQLVIDSLRQATGIEP